MQHYKFPRAFKFGSFFALMLFTILLTGTLYAAPKVGPITPENSVIGQNANDRFGAGEEVHTLPNGNIVIVNPYLNSNRGAVTCLTPNEYKTGGSVISAANALVGSNAGDNVGLGGITVLSNGNYVVSSPEWNNDAGASTWVNGATCFPYGESSRGAVVSGSNSLVGSNVNDRVGDYGWGPGITALNNGNYVVASPNWNSSSGAATWVNGSTGTAGAINAANSLIGSNGDRVSDGGIAALSNGNYVVASPSWTNDTIPGVGAATWGNGATGLVGFVSPANSLIGTQEYDRVGEGGIPGTGGITALTNGNYVVNSPSWNNSAGAATWGDGATGTVGVVSIANSLIGSNEGDYVGTGGIVALANGNYVVSSEAWTNAETLYVGAVTWGDGATGTVGIVSAANSLIGSNEGDFIGTGGITPLTNGHYVISSPFWSSNSVMRVGAATWVNGSTATTGVISAANSLIGSNEGDHVSMNDDDASPNAGVTALSNGNYVVSSPRWNNSIGAATWGDGFTGTVGIVDVTNSLVGSHTHDSVSSGRITPLTNGNYVVSSLGWAELGATTWANGEGGTVGFVSAANSLIGTRNDPLSYDSILPLTNGNYVVKSSFWDNGAGVEEGAITWGNGEGGTVGIVGPQNSIVGSESFSAIPAVALSNGNYVVRSPYWDNGTIANVGAVLVGDGATGTVATFSEDNSLIGSTIGDSVGGGWIHALPDGSFIVSSPGWDNGATQNVGAITWSDGTLFAPNSAPILAEIGNKTVDEGNTLTFDVNASDVDAPPQTLTFSIAGAPEDASFDTATGEFSWTTTDAEGGQVFNVTLTVTDDGEPALSDSEEFTITVNEVNEDNNTPVLAEIGDQTVDVGATVTFDAEATDSDEPVQTMIFSIAGAPEDASFDTATGAFSWTADAADGGQTFNVTVTVTDDGEPAANDSEDFTITVNPVIVEEINYLPNASFENPRTTNKTAAGWNGVGLTTNDKRICDTDAKTYAHDGECAFRFQFNGATAPTRTLQRNLNVNNFAKNEAIELRGMVKANGLTAGARLIVKVVYNNGKTESASVKLTAGSYEYSPFATQIMIKRPAKKITVQIKAGSAKGTFFVDDMAVVKVVAPLTIDDGTTDSGLRGLR